MPAGRSRPVRRRLLLDVSFYATAALAPLAIIAWLMRLWTLSLSTPFLYKGDALATLADIKGWFETGSIFSNAALGAPGVAELYDYPGSDGLNVIIVRFFGIVGAGPVSAMNLFYLLGYPAVGLATAFVLRRMHLSRLSSLAVATLFALVPYHWMRGENHLFLSMYWIIPLLMLVLVWLDSSNPPLVKLGTEGRLPFNLRSSRTIAALAICAAAGACGVYYLFFGCFFLVVVGVRAAIRDRDYRPVLAAAMLVFISGVVFAVQMAPSAVYSARHGKNPEAAVRNPYESETYGLRITQMLLPIDNHRVAALAAKRARYESTSPGGNTEANLAALGVIGSLGLLASISALLLGWPRDRRRRGRPPEDAEPPGLGWLGMLTVSAVLLGTVAGFGAVFAGAVSPQIRAYNRISVFIALFVLATLGILADRFLQFRSGTKWRTAALVVIAGVVVLGVLDQTPSELASGPRFSQAEYSRDAAFGLQVQKAVPAGASIFQLPYWPFPETPPLYGMQDYDPFMGYVHTSGLRWSYGAIKGRPDAAWQQATAALPPVAMIERLRGAGFSALWVQLNGYADGGTAIKRSLDKLLGVPVAMREDGVVAIWRL